MLKVIVRRDGRARGNRIPGTLLLQTANDACEAQGAAEATEERGLSAESNVGSSSSP